MQEIEIEKRYLVPANKIDGLLAQAEVLSSAHMIDYYVPNGDQHKDLRLRQQGDKYVITRKRPIKSGGSIVMEEITMELSKEEFQILSSGITSFVEKDRYKIIFAGREAEFDVLSGRHAGLVVLEFEFENTDDMAKFEAEQELDLQDITGLEWLATGKLAETDFAALAPKIEELCLTK